MFFTAIVLCSAFFSIPVYEAGKELIHLDSNASEFYWESFYFSQILKVDLDDIKFPRDSNLLQYVNDSLYFHSSQVSSQKGSIHLLTLLALKGHKISKEKL